MISVASRKAKGRNLQKWVRDLILNVFPVLTIDDVKSTSMGSGGTDIQLSTAGKEAFPYAIECKSQKNGFTAIYGAYEQSKANSAGLTPVVIIKQNGLKPLAIVDAEWFIRSVA